MKEKYQIYLPHQFRPRVQSAGWVPQLSNKKMKTLFLSNMSKSWRLTSTFFPITRIMKKYLNFYYVWVFLKFGYALAMLIFGTFIVDFLKREARKTKEVYNWGKKWIPASNVSEQDKFAQFAVNINYLSKIRTISRIFSY